MNTRALSLQTFAHFMISLVLCIALITPSLAGKRLDNFGQSLKDAGISTIIIGKITTNPILSPFKVKVSTKNGVVTLSGLVNTDLQFEKAVTIAQSTKGVKDVNATNLKIKTSKNPISDTLITAKIKGLLLRDKILNDQQLSNANFQIETKDGVVYIVGTVSSKAQKKHIVKVAKSIEGVKSVKVDLNVNGNNTTSQ